MCRLSWNLGASTYWKPHGLSRFVMGLLFTEQIRVMKRKSPDANQIAHSPQIIYAVRHGNMNNKILNKTFCLKYSRIFCTLYFITRIIVICVKQILLFYDTKYIFLLFYNFIEITLIFLIYYVMDIFYPHLQKSILKIRPCITFPIMPKLLYFNRFVLSVEMIFTKKGVLFEILSFFQQQTKETIQ